MTHWRKHQGLALHFTCEKREFFRSNILFLYEYFNENKVFNIKFHSEIHWPQLKCGIVLPFLEVKIMNNLVKMCTCKFRLEWGLIVNTSNVDMHLIFMLLTRWLSSDMFFSFSFSQSICFSTQCAHAYERDSMPAA